MSALVWIDWTILGVITLSALLSLTRGFMREAVSLLSLLVAVVVARDPARPPTLEDLRDHCSQVLPRWAAPRELLLVPSIARTSLGKVQRDALMRSASVER